MPRLTQLISACLLVICCSLGGHEHPKVLVLWNSKQLRHAPPLTCAYCHVFDIGTTQGSNSINAQFEIVIIDGHSLPNSDILGMSSTRIVNILRPFSPRLIVLNTCYGAEVKFMEELRDGLTSAEWILASPSPLPWRGISIKEDCLRAMGPSPQCIEHSGKLALYSGQDISMVQEQAQKLKKELSSCHVSIAWSRIFPPYACIRSRGTPSAVLSISPDEIKQICHKDLSGITMVPCNDSDLHSSIRADFIN